MSSPLVSIIMPVYNAGKYFKNCVDSLLNQTLKDIEIIMVLDKPTDGTDKQAYEYAKKDHRIVILENDENLHIGLTRNRALSMARGKYIAFSDHDDSRELNMYESLYLLAEENNYDILFSLPTLKSGENIVCWNYKGNREELRSFILSDLIGFGNYYRSCPNFCFLHFNLYKRSLIEKFKIRFVDTRVITPEDVLFNLECVYHAKRVGYINSTFYYHEEYLESTGRSISYSNCKLRLEGMNYIYNFMIEHGLYDMYLPNFYIYVKKEVLNSLARSTGSVFNLKTMRSNLLLMKQYNFVKEAFKTYMTIGYPTRLSKNIVRFFLSLYLSR